MLFDHHEATLRQSHVVCTQNFQPIFLRLPPTSLPPSGNVHEQSTAYDTDHTTGLYKSFSAGKIYCSHGTANLIVELMGVNRERVVPLPMDTPVLVAGFELTLIDANHCPAAVM